MALNRQQRTQAENVLRLLGLEGPFRVAGVREWRMWARGQVRRLVVIDGPGTVYTARLSGGAWQQATADPHLEVALIAAAELLRWILARITART